jgi:TP901 family phage tail tape measure protein
MAFNINAQVILSGPKNLGKISKQIQRGLGQSGSIKVAIDPSSLRNIKILNSTVSNLNGNVTNLNQSATKLQSTLGGVNRNISKASSSTANFSKNQSNTASNIKAVNVALQQQNKSLGNLGKRFLSTAKTAIAFGLISRPIYDLQRAFIGATKDAVAFEKELVKISQVTGQTVKQLSSLRNDINRLATSLGVSANELAETARIIAQTGKTAEETRIILEALSRSTLAPTFGAIADTTEGLVAALGQFNLEAKDSEAILGALNRVSKNFAVEAEDLVSVIRRTGGVFAQAAGDSRGTIQALEELIAVFTAVRANTRESADTIAAGLRTIFSRIQRRGTIEFLEQFGVQLTNAKGQFIGVFPAFDELSKRLDVLIRQGDALTLSAIAEELGGIRQIGKLLPAIANFDDARKALAEAQKGAAEGLSGDVAKALDTIDNRLKRVRESFNELIRTVFESPAFQAFAKTILTVSEQLLKLSTSIVKFIEPLLPVLAALGAAKLGQVVGGAIGGGGLASAASTVSGQATATNTAQVAAAAQQSVSIEQQMLSVLNQMSTQLSNIFSLQSADNKLRNTQLSNLIQINQSGFNQVATAQRTSGATPAFAGVRGPRRRASGGQIYGFNRGGMVPGTGNRDTVPAMLTPGEFVIKKSSVESIGAGQLASMNKYAAGGLVVDFNNQVFGGAGLEGTAAGAQLATITKPENVNNIKKAIENKLPTTGVKRGDASNTGLGTDFEDKINKAKDTDTIKLTSNQKSNIAAKAGIKQKDIPTTKKGLKGLGIFQTSKGQDAPIDLNKISSIQLRGIVSSFASTKKIREAGLLNEIKDLTQDAFSGLISNITSSQVFSEIGVKGTPLDPSDESLQTAVKSLINSDPKSARTTIEGYVLEGLISSIGKIPLEGSDEAFDFVGARAASISEGIDDIFGSGAGNTLSKLKAFDAKRTIDNATRRNIILKKIPTLFDSDDVAKVSIAKRNKGGGISGTDTVPALLTPGEFVFNKKSASKIGYGNLSRMNKDGVQGFNKGGVVGFQRGGKQTS